MAQPKKELNQLNQNIQIYLLLQMFAYVGLPYLDIVELLNKTVI